MAPAFLDAVRDALALLLPIDCAGCGSADRPLCDTCRSVLAVAVTPRTVAGVPTFTSLRYESEVRRIVLALKEEGRTDVARELAPAFSAALIAAHDVEPEALVVRVPRSPSSYRRRGYDPLGLLLRRAGWPRGTGLRQARHTVSQKTLGLEERAVNLSNTMIASDRLASRKIIIVDDIITTGGTVAEAARAITAVGGAPVAVAALAFTPRLRGIRDIGSVGDYGGAKGAGTA
ncbi:ComF family protein [Microbacteriaceae bacterium SG_E_30_P1]|uniref:ComF family protein n=1 Tax=Antiquaquibacter oligotrophicus TaxID=2880260 RepID=A0ABT6KRC1_9MICO|nr:phosphoribosyltransferase family protein [Antiquaquibacter oligotrophicus]MDH6181647.1 ComF family protein [Antiquaquibacter oligotrophicus]UDF12669.1 ComF family protein [Antiquaquibacter oligotrophicus]